MKAVTLQKLGVVVLAVLVSMVLWSGCGGGGSSSGSGGGSNTLFYAVKATTPTFAAASPGKPQNTKGKIYSAMSYSDPAMMVVYQLLRNYTYPTDEGVVDMSNIYKILWEAGGKLDDAKYICSAMTSTLDSSISPYLFSDFLGHSYTCGGNIAESVQPGYGSSFAYEETGTLRQVLASYKWERAGENQRTIGTIQASFDDTTKDVELIFAQAVQYTLSGTGFGTRARITGNSGTHRFQLKMLSGSTSLVGSGLSQGAGNYFLIKSDTNYYCIPATATEADLAIMMPTGVTANCSTYQTEVDGASPYISGDLPNIDHSDFNNGVSGTPVFYMMF